MMARAICARAHRLGYEGASVSAVDRGHIAVEPSGIGGKPGPDPLVVPSDVRFYDWEPNIYGDPSEGGGALPGTAPFNGLFPAVEFASKQKPRAEKEDIPPGGPSTEVKKRTGGRQGDIQRYYDQRNDSAGDKFYLFGPGDGPTRPFIPPGAAYGEPTGSFFSSCEEIAETYRNRPDPRHAGGTDEKIDGACGAELRALGEAGPPRGSTAVKVPQGVLVVLNQASALPPNGSRAALTFFVIEDDSELTGSEIKDPEQDVDPNTNAPNVTFLFTDEGKAAFKSVTKRISQRGLLQGSHQNFAITLDNQIVSIAYIDPSRYPEGIDGSNGAEISGVGNVADARRVATELAVGPLPGTVHRVR
jgi:hypothetical protein